MKNTGSKHSLSITEETLEGIPFKVGHIQMPDFKRNAGEIFRYILANSIILVIWEAEETEPVVLCSAAAYSWMLEHDLEDAPKSGN